MTGLYFMFVTIPLCYGLIVGFLDLYLDEVRD